MEASGRGGGGWITGSFYIVNGRKRLDVWSQQQPLTPPASRDESSLYCVQINPPILLPHTENNGALISNNRGPCVCVCPTVKRSTVQSKEIMKATFLRPPPPCLM